MEDNPRLKRFPKYEELYPNGELVLDKFNIQNITNLAHIVVQKHFKNYDELEELTQVGVCSILNSLNEGKFDPSKGSIKNYLYTSIRNGCTNYLYHYKNAKKEVIVDEHTDGAYVDNDLHTIDDRIIVEFFEQCEDIYKVPLDQFKWHLSTLGLPTGIIKPNDIGDVYKLNKCFIKFIKYYLGEC